MKTSSVCLLLAGFLPATMAFPMEMMQKLQHDPKLMAVAMDLMSKRQTGADAATAVFEPAPGFDSKAQYIDVSAGSGHEWQAPGPNDLRGPCPGLNAFANHNFIPRNGYATVDQFINATTSVVGMGLDLATFLATLGALIDSGDLHSWSIGGTPPPGVGPAAAQNGHGLSGSHNKYESDVSPTRPDLYEYGNNYIPRADQFQELIDTSPGGYVTLDSLTAFRAKRFQESLSKNPYFFNGPFSGVLVQPAAYTFIFRFMANHSAAFPVGQLNYANIQSWFAIPGQSGSYTVQFGQERIPYNWYRRSQVVPYTIPYFLGDVVVAAGLHPEFLDIGGNIGGKTNNFGGVDATDLSGGLFKSADLLKGNNLGCFAYQAAAQVKADLLLSGVLNQLQSLVGSVVKELSCPQLQQFDANYLHQFDGYEKAPVYG